LTVDVVCTAPHARMVFLSAPSDLDARAAALGQATAHLVATAAQAAAEHGLPGAAAALNEALTLPARRAALARLRAGPGPDAPPGPAPAGGAPTPPPPLLAAVNDADTALAQLDAMVDEASARDREADPDPARHTFPRLDVVEDPEQGDEVASKRKPSTWTYDE